MKLRLYRLQPINEYAYNSPWYPLSGTAREIIVLAYNKPHAREIADRVAGTENIRGQNPWKSTKWSTCDRVEEKAGIISRLIIP